MSKLIKIFLLACFILYGKAQGQIVTSGNLANYINTAIGNMPGSSGNNYQDPSTANLTTWGNVITNILNGNYSAAHSGADSIGYQLLAYTDNSVTPNKLYYVLEKKPSSTNHWGIFIYNPVPSRTKLMIQCPHPKYDLNTGQQGFYILKKVGAKALFISGTHRCNNSTSTSCSGTSTVCGDSGPYKISDQAHNASSTLQRITEIFNSSISGLIVIQPHGFSKDEGDPDLIISNGKATYPTGTDYLVNFKNNLLKINPNLTFKVIHIDTDWTKLTATTNVQGRLINGSSNPCTVNPTSANGRFLHLEQVYTGLRDNQTNWAKVANAIAMTIPINPAQSGNWNSSDTWPGGIFPDTIDHVQILSGQTITVNSSDSKCNHISFASSTSKLAMASGGVLNVYGDFTLYSNTHNAFSSWASGAKICFKGSFKQLLSGWHTTSSTTINTTLMEVQVDKTGDTLQTPGTDMKLALGTSLEIINGVVYIDTADDINGKTLDGSGSSSPAITIQSGGTFVMHEGFSHIRSGTSGSNPIGKMTIYGNAILASASNLGINFNNIDIESGGSLTLASFSNSNPNNFKPGTLTAKSGSSVTNSSVVNFWNSSSVLDLQNGAVYYVTAATSVFPPSFTNNGTVNYSRNGTQTLYSRTYNNLTISGTDDKTADGNVIVGGTLNLSGGNIVTGSYTLTLGTSASSIGSLSRTSGWIVGKFKRWFAASTVTYRTFPIGTANNYRPANISFTSAPSGGTLLAFFNESNPGSAGLPLLDDTVYIYNVCSEGYWTIQAGDGLSGGVYSMNLAPDGFSNIKNFSSLRILKRNTGGNWTLDGIHDEATTVVKRTNLSGFSEFGIGGSTDNPFQLKNLNLKVLPEGLYKQTADSLSYGDTIMVYLRDTLAPFKIWDSLKSVLDKNGNTSLYFENASDNKLYYIEVKHRNSIRTWSTYGNKFQNSVMNYDFSTASNKAYGNNLVLVGSKYCMFSGDVNQDGQIDLTDLLIIDYDNQNFITGYVVTDINGDGQITLDDLILADKNNQNFVSAVTPETMLFMLPVIKQKLINEK